MLAEDNYLVREGTRRLLQDSGEVEVLAAVGTADELRDAVRRISARRRHHRHPHAAGPPHGGHRGRACHPRRPSRASGWWCCRSTPTRPTPSQLLRDGTAGLAYLLKDRLGDVEDLVRALREVGAGGSVIDPVVVDALVAAAARTASHRCGADARELDVLREMAQGRTNAGIEPALHLSASTVEKHVNSIFTKLRLADAPVHRRVAAVLAFLKG